MYNFEQYKDEVIQLRRHFHKHPELGFQEYETSKFIQEYLKNLGLEPKVGYGCTCSFGRKRCCICI